MVLTTSLTTSPPRCAARAAVAASWLAWRALSAFWPTVAVSCSMLEAVSSSEAACSMVREDKLRLPSAISWAPSWISWLLSRTVPTVAARRCWIWASEVNN
ncbi:hypothetical protein D3C81_1479970 [compost metagenome]